MKRIFVLTMIAAMFCTSAEGAGIVYGADVAPVMAVQAADENPPVVISPNPAQDDSDSMPDMSNPFIGCDSLDEAGSIAGYKKEFISVISSDLIQVTYQDGENSLCIRKAAGDGDISGDYNRYDENKTAKIGNIQADMRGTDGKVSTAVWNREGFAYSLYRIFNFSLQETKIRHTYLKAILEMA